MDDEQRAIERVRVLHGHIDPDSAYLVEDYPYGYRLRCQIRYWIETAAKGAKKGQQRFVSQTTNPKQAGTVWNKPKASTYVGMAVLYLDRDDHVQWWGAGLYLTPVQDARMRLMGIHDHLDDAQRDRYHAFLAVSRRYQRQWDEWEEKVTALAAEIRYTGHDPEITNGVWTVPDGRRFYLGEDAAAYVTVARQRNAPGQV